jgi:hypothetical protein
MTRHGLARFPPRRELPADVTIAKLPLLGRTWYERGFWYWCRRSGGVIVFAVAAAVYAGIIFGVMSAAGPAGSAGYLAVLIAEVVLSLVTAVPAFRHMQRQADGPAPSAARQRSVRAGGVSASLVFRSGVVGGALLAVSVLLTAGFVLAGLVMSFAPVLPVEQHARQVLADRLNLARLRESNTHHSARRRRRR